MVRVKSGVVQMKTFQALNYPQARSLEVHFASGVERSQKSESVSSVLNLQHVCVLFRKPRNAHFDRNLKCTRQNLGSKRKETGKISRVLILPFGFISSSDLRAS